MLHALLLAAVMQASEPTQSSAQTTSTKSSKAEINHQNDLKKDSEMGKKYSAEVDKELKPTENKEYQERADRIGQRVAELARSYQPRSLWGDKRLNPFDYQFKVVKGEDVNAFSLPGGYIYIYEGLMKYVESDDELAAVLCHEVAHASLRHVATLQRERNKIGVATLPLILVMIFTKGSELGTGLFELNSLIGTAKGSGWSQQAEEAADCAGFQYMQRLGYNTSGMLTFMERLAADERGRPKIDWGIYRTHPPSKDRAVKLRGYLTQAHLPFHRSEVTSRFSTKSVKMNDGTYQISFGDRVLFHFAGAQAEERSDQAVQKLNDFFDQTPDQFELKISPKGAVTGRAKSLFTITQEDAQAAHVSLDACIKNTETALRAAIYNLGIDVWDLR